MPTFTIHIRGQVQGVGFRPHVYRLARQFRLRGTVSNGVDGVRIKVSGLEKAVRAFQHALHTCPPKRATILSTHSEQIAEETFPDFRIIPSDAEGEPDELMHYARDRAECLPQEIEFHQASAEDLPLEDGSVDYAFSYALMKHLPVPVQYKVLAEFARVSRKGVICSFPGPCAPGTPGCTMPPMATCAVGSRALIAWYASR